MPGQVFPQATPATSKVYYSYMQNIISMKQWMFGFLLTGVVGVVVLVPFGASAASCSFTRDLQMGVMGDDVKCLQQYLNSSGFKIAETGPGSVGKETGEFKTLTEAAVVAWQKANQLSPASGYFGPKSRQAYSTLMAGGSSKPVATSTSGSSSLEAQLELLKQQLQNAGKPTTAQPVNTAAVSSAHDLLEEVLDLLEDVEDGIEDIDDADLKEEAEDSLKDARSDFYAGLRAYISSDYSEAEDYFDDAIGSLEDADDTLGEGGNKSDAEDLIDEVNDQIDEVEVLIEEADAAGEATSESEDLLDEAKDVLDEAETALDDGDYEDALELAEEAEDLVNDAEDMIGESGGNSDVDDALNDARNELDDVRDDVESALDDDEDVGDAEDLLDEAEDLLDEAEDALNDGDEDDAEDLIDEALDMIDEARDEF